MNKRVDTVKTDRPSGLKAEPPGWGSDYLADVLRSLDVEYLTLVPGASFRGLHDSLVNYLGNRRPAMLLCLHEEHAVAIAHGYAKVTEQPMAVVLHSNVGVMHASMAVFNAWCDRVPMLLYGATGPMDASARRPWIDWIHTCADQAALIRHFVKWDNQPASLQAAGEAMLRAAQISRTVPRGPTYVVFDAALQEARLDTAPALPDAARYAASGPLNPDPGAVEAAARLLAGAERPLLLPGRGARSPDAWNDRIALAERIGARVFTDLKTAAAFPTGHPQHALVVKYIGEPAQRIFRDSDVILSLDWIDLAGTLRQVWKDGRVTAKVIHASADALVHNGWSMDHQGLPPADVNMLADPDATVRALLAALPGRGRRRRRSAATADPATRARPRRAASDGIGVLALADAVNELAARTPTSLIRINIGWPAGAMRHDHPLDFLGNDGGGGVGSGCGLAIGAGLALRDSGRLPLAVLGDGDFLMSASALWTAARHRVPVLIVVANNQSFFNDELHQERMAIKRGRAPQNRWIGQRISGPDVDVCALARAQGVVGIGPVTQWRQLRSALREAAGRVRRGETVVLDARVAAEYDAPLTNLMVRPDE